MSTSRSITTSFPVGLFCLATISGPLPKLSDGAQEEAKPEPEPDESHLRLLEREEEELPRLPYTEGTWED